MSDLNGTVLDHVNQTTVCEIPPNAWVLTPPGFDYRLASRPGSDVAGAVFDCLVDQASRSGCTSGSSDPNWGTALVVFSLVLLLCLCRWANSRRAQHAGDEAIPLRPALPQQKGWAV